MMYTLKETLEKLNITKYKFDKLKKHGYINPSKIDKWNGMYYIEELVIDSKEVDKLTPKRLEKIFEKIKREESKDLLTKWKNKVYRHNLKMLKNNAENYIYNFESQQSFLDAVDRLNGESIYYKKALKLEQNSKYKVKKIGEHVFNFWKNPLFKNNNLDSYLKPMMYRSSGEFFISNIVVDIIEVSNRKDDTDFEWFGFIKEFNHVEEISEKCECCGRIVTIPGKVFAYNNHDKLCLRCYNDLIKKDKGKKYKYNLLNNEDAIILDFETASLYSRDGIVSISAINMQGEILLDEKVKPSGEISIGAYQYHNISKEDLVDCPSFSDLKEKLMNLLDGKYVIFSHEFHRDFFESLMERYEMFEKLEGMFFVNNLYEESLIDYEISCCDLNTTHYKSYDSLADCFDMLRCLK